MDLTIITVNWNTGKLLANSISSIYDTVKDISYEIIVVDNGSTDNSCHLIEENFPLVRIISKNQNLGFSAAINFAIDHVNGRFILIIHPDIKFLPNTINHLLDFIIEHPGIGIVGGNLIYPDGSLNYCPIVRRTIRVELIDLGFPIRNIDEYISEFSRVMLRKNVSLYWDHKTVTESATIWNACMMFRMEVINDIGKFSEDFFVWFADTDWCYRASDAGWKMYYLPEAVALHYEKQSKEYLSNSMVEYKFNSLKVADAMRRDLNILLNRHYGHLYIAISNLIHSIAILKARLHNILMNLN